MIYGYSRVSDKMMNDESQIEKLKEYRCDEIISEKVTGVAEDRKLVDLIENQISEGDKLVITDVTRFARSSIQAILMADQLHKKGVDLVILNLGIDTTTPAGKMVFNVMTAMAEFEREQTKERQRRGIEHAKKQGKHLGRKASWSKEGLESALEEYQETNKSVKEIVSVYNIPRSSFYVELKRREITRKK
ncbi:recombinase family protein [Halobacillus faecis]|uniref:DNA invertase n=1 Tax=Halobacillus faecis TaxID=360184 RepID=A0A511WZ57_9BACI|nr:recombinase family protein [Halobacillus faecis]GEN55502.1 DNA invertase [Halobacillus faecis]